ncbi:MAG TPA: hypothetical protein VGZ52_12080 [Acidimicrobiales bacterium]|nr:hypothetical protein [Acidimicrobiales bacterium]
MKRTILILLVSLVLLGCSSSSKPASGSSTSSSSATTPSSSSSTSASSSAATSTASSSAATLSSATNATIGQAILVNGAGKTVYMYMPDGTATTSSVPAGLKGVWPALTATGTPTAGTGVDQSKLKSNSQPDGTSIVSYNGHLLYNFSNDSAPGDAKGQGLGGIWFVLSPAGDKIG